MTKTLVAGALLSLAAAAACAHTTVTDAWVRGTVATQSASGMFAKITSEHGGRLVSVSSPWAGMAQVHEMSMQGSVMKMREVGGGLVLPPGKTVELSPGGYHVMLMGLKQQLKAGEMVPITLVVEDNDATRETIELKVPVRALGK